MSVPPSVLIADDDEDIRALLSVILTRAGFDTLAVDGGVPVLEVIDQARFPDEIPGVFVLDVRMPDVDGLELCRRLKNDAHTADRLVLLISAESSAADIAAGFAAGCDDYLAKPFGARELVGRVEALLCGMPGSPQSPGGVADAVLVTQRSA